MRIMYDMIILINLSFLAVHLISASNEFPENIANNRNVFKESLDREDEEFTFHFPGDKWTTEAIKDIAYYLRYHKFNDWDYRYYEEKPNENVLGFFGAFPIPQLRSLHWEVKANCYNDFFQCISYLYSIVNTAPFSRNEDSAIIKANVHNESIIKKMYNECTERHAYANKIGLPFDDPAEKFQWSVTASYYMCWYTMSGIPVLSMIGENCDNFANCRDTYFYNHNHDPRADDNISFKCAIYSFCPDPCCPIKHVQSINVCHRNKGNPCLEENSEEEILKKVCYMDRKYNQSFKDIISNKWNISCNCRKGFTWVSKFGTCVDINECLVGIHECDVISQNCLNVPGSYLCICKWEFYFNVNSSLCLRRNTIL